jgi:hypothetical protein
MSKHYSLSRDQVRELCPSCADKMQLARIKELKLAADERGNLLPSDEVTIKLFAGFSQGLCDKFGPDKGLFTRCAEHMAGKVDDENAFCASLEKFCTGHRPAEKNHVESYVIKHEGDEWVLYNHTGDKVLGRHKSEADALAQERAIQVAKHHTMHEGDDMKAMMEKLRKEHPDATEKELEDMHAAMMAKMKGHAVTGLKNMTRDEVYKKCPDCAGKMAGNSQDMPVDAGGHMNHICGKGTRAMAEELHVAEYSNDIKGVEIFGAGTHNGDEYTEKDLDDIVSAFNTLDYRPAVKVGHTKDKPGSPAYGWVQNLKRVGNKIHADLTDMHDSVVDAIRNKNYDRVSSEIYFNLKRGGKEFRRALKAVALLGAEVPAVANLVPLHKMEFAAEGFEKVGTLEQELNVPSQALVDALAERVAGLVNLMKEHDMAKNAEEIKTLKAQVEEFNQKIEELKEKKGKDMSDEDLAKDPEYKELVAKAEEISDKIAELENDDGDTEEKIAQLTKQLTESADREKAAAKAHKELSDKVERIERDRLNLQIGERVKACKIPAFRASLEGLYAYALEHDEAKVKVYSKDKEGKDTAAEKTLAEVVDGVVSEINAQSEKLFKAMAYSGMKAREDGVIEEDVGAEIQKRVSKYRVEHKDVKKYEEALKAVLSDDAELAQRYRDSLGKGQ